MSNGGGRRPATMAWILCAVVALANLVACASGNDGAAPTSSLPDKSSSAPPTTGPGTTAPPATEPGPPGGPVPAGFAAASVTFVSLQTGWVLGTAPCDSPPCTSLVRTGDGGRTWVGIPAPKAELTVEQGSGTGVSHVRFADLENGWAFGPGLWVTHDGGAHWTESTLPGFEARFAVSALEAGAGVVQLSVIDSDGVHILTSPVSTDAWQRSPTTVPLGAGPVPGTQIVLQGNSGWLVEVNRTVVGGARLAGGSWVSWPPPCADAGGSVSLAASTPDDLVALCHEGEWNDRPRADRAYVSGDGGTTFGVAGGPVPCCAGIVASGRKGTAVAAGSDDGTAVLLGSFDGGSTWATVYRGEKSSWTEIGFTSPTQGVAVGRRSDSEGGSLVMTLDGGHTWNAVPFV